MPARSAKKSAIGRFVFIGARAPFDTGLFWSRSDLMMVGRPLMACIRHPTRQRRVATHEVIPTDSAHRTRSHVSPGALGIPPGTSSRDDAHVALRRSQSRPALATC